VNDAAEGWWSVIMRRKCGSSGGCGSASGSRRQLSRWVKRTVCARRMRTGGEEREWLPQFSCGGGEWQKVQRVQRGQIWTYRHSEDRGKCREHRRIQKRGIHDADERRSDTMMTISAALATRTRTRNHLFGNPLITPSGYFTFQRCLIFFSPSACMRIALPSCAELSNKSSSPPEQLGWN